MATTEAVDSRFDTMEVRIEQVARHSGDDLQMRLESPEACRHLVEDTGIVSDGALGTELCRSAHAGQRFDAEGIDARRCRFVRCGAWVEN